MKTKEQELKELKQKLNLIESQTPEDNIRYLLNQIEVGNITTSENERVTSILKLVQSSIQHLNLKLASKPKKKQK